MITTQELNEHLIKLGVDYIKAIDIVTKWSPHPFCVGSQHIKRYALDTTKPCAMRINEETGEWSNKRNTKKGITGHCGLSHEEHIPSVYVPFQVETQLTDKELKHLNDLLKPDAELDKVFKANDIVGFQFYSNQTLEKAENISGK